MKVDILCSDKNHPVMGALSGWIANLGGQHSARVIHSRSDALGGDILYLVSCTELVSSSLRKNYKNCMVIHASDLPKGRGWSPHIWDVLHGAEEITVTLLEADDPVDSGAIWAKRKVAIPKTALHDEINSLIFDAETDLMSEGIRLVELGLEPASQSDVGVTYFRRRTPSDSEVNPMLPLVESFDLLRVSDPRRYPAFFVLHGVKYNIEIRKALGDE
jgi:methionyl-tRNA formyltransferase